MAKYPYIWRWSKWPRGSWDSKTPGTRKGQRCKLVCEGKGPGPKNALIEFEDGEQIVVTRAARRFALGQAS